MKCYSLISLILLLASPVVGQDWQVVNVPLDENITSVCFVHPDTGFVVTTKGKIGRTFDAGKTWKVSLVAANIQLEDLSFVNSRLGMVCGRNGVLYRTVDGGETWENKSLKDTIPWFLDVEMFNSKTGLVIGLSRDSLSPFGSLVYRTTDGGVTWKKQKPVGLGCSELQYRPGEPVYLLAFGKIYVSHDLGKSWQSYKTVEGLLARTLSIRGKTGILGGPNGMGAYSADSGKTWTTLDLGMDKIYIAAELVDEQVGYLGGYPSTMMRTSDGGKTWKQELMARSFNVLDMCLIGDRLYAVGSEGGMIFKKVK
jgi:photosystem II stability/assembly factor-like uncharacterized protein